MCKFIEMTNIEMENLVSDTLNVAWYTVDGDYERNVNSCGIERMIELWQYNKYPLYEFLGYTTRVEKNYEAVATYDGGRITKAEYDVYYKSFANILSTYYGYPDYLIPEEIAKKAAVDKVIVKLKCKTVYLRI